MPVASLTLRNVGPLAEASFEFDSSISVLVGPNNCGKTTVLLALADILLESFTVPAKLISPNCSFHLRLERDQRPEISGTLPFAKETKESSNYREQMESLGYRIFAPAVRLGTDFRSEGPGQRRTAPENVDLVRRLQSGWWDRLQRPALWSDDTRIVQQIVDLDYRSYREKRPAIRNTLDSIAELASAVTEGFPMQFAGIGDDGEGLFPRFKTPDGVVAMDVLSQGTQSLLHWCAQLVIGFAEYYDYPDSLSSKPGVLLLDEIDAHLHPSWQRRILPAINQRFPKLQVICAAHSPMTLAGLKAGQAQLMSRDSAGRVNVTTNQTDILGWSADEIYSALLGVEPTDVGTTRRLTRIRELRLKESALTGSEAEELDRLRHEVGQAVSAGATEEAAELVAARLTQELRSARTRLPVNDKKSPPRKR